MLISHDGRTVLLGVPKTGTQTARAVLGPGAVDLAGPRFQHPKWRDVVLQQAVAPDVRVFAFWRDPLDRLASAIRFHRERIHWSFFSMFPERFRDLEQPPVIPGSAAPADVAERIATIPDTEIWQHHLTRGFAIYERQSGWFAAPNLTILPFSEFETEIARLAELFGVTPGAIPKLNTTGDTTISPALAQEARAFYAEDYAFRPA